MENVTTETLSRQLVKEMSRRRFYMFAFVVVVVALINELFSELAVNPIFAFDDSVTLVLALVAIVYFAVTWRKGEAGIRRGNNIAVIVGVVILLVAIYALTIETGESLGDEPASALFGILLLVNRFI